MPHLRLRSFVLAIVAAMVGIGAATAQALTARVWFPRNVLPLPGWDYVTGWGTPVLGPFMQDVDGGTAPVTPPAQ